MSTNRNQKTIDNAAKMTKKEIENLGSRTLAIIKDNAGTLASTATAGARISGQADRELTRRLKAKGKNR